MRVESRCGKRVGGAVRWWRQVTWRRSKEGDDNNEVKPRSSLLRLKLGQDTMSLSMSMQVEMTLSSSIRNRGLAKTLALHLKYSSMEWPNETHGAGRWENCLRNSCHKNQKRWAGTNWVERVEKRQGCDFWGGKKEKGEPVEVLVVVISREERRARRSETRRWQSFWSRWGV